MTLGLSGFSHQRDDYVHSSWLQDLAGNVAGDVTRLLGSLLLSSLPLLRKPFMVPFSSGHSLGCLTALCALPGAAMAPHNPGTHCSSAQEILGKATSSHVFSCGWKGVGTRCSTPSEHLGNNSEPSQVSAFPCPGHRTRAAPACLQSTRTTVPRTNCSGRDAANGEWSCSTRGPPLGSPGIVHCPARRRRTTLPRTPRRSVGQ